MNTPSPLPTSAEFLTRLARFHNDGRLKELARLAGVNYNTLWQRQRREFTPKLEDVQVLWPLMDAMDAADAARTQSLLQRARQK